ncbi:MAG: cytochrome-c oxidase, cbb3-type subunit III [Alphaproteobacteria bacterium]
MSVEEKYDPHTGHRMTGHEWNGIEELNTPVPRLVWISLIVTGLFALVYWILMPAWPLGVTYTKGLLGVDQRVIVTEDVERAKADRFVWADKVETMDLETIAADEELMGIVRQSGRALFGDNCAACHGTDAKGGEGYPDLTDQAWLWGGDPETIAETIRVGVNVPHDESRQSEMMAFGRDQMLERDAILNVVAYVQSLSDPSLADGDQAEAVAAGEEVFIENCAACHGEDGKGMVELGAPDLTDDAWLFGGDRDSIYSTVWNGHQGQMPAWENRLSTVDQKILTLYVLDLAEAAP